VADKRHTYSIRVDWTGNQGTGTSAYRAYSRAHEISAQGKTAIAGSSDPVFRGDRRDGIRRSSSSPRFPLVPALVPASLRRRQYRGRSIRG
jgi:hypothetical protein